MGSVSRQGSDGVWRQLGDDGAWHPLETCDNPYLDEFATGLMQTQQMIQLAAVSATAYRKFLIADGFEEHIAQQLAGNLLTMWQQTLMGSLRGKPGAG